MLLSILIGAFFMVTGFVLTPWALRAMGTTEEALPGAILYLRVYFLGMVPNVIYNMGTGVLRAIGETPAGDGVELLDQLHETTGTAIPRRLAALKGKARRFDLTCEKPGMDGVVLEFLK